MTWEMPSSGIGKSKHQIWRRELAAQALKFCPRCARILSIEEFHMRRESKDGRATYCKRCRKLWQLYSR